MSSNDIAIKVENISKRYRIGMKENMHDSFGGALFEFMKSPLKNYRKYRSLYMFDDIESDQKHNPESNPSDIIWALGDVSFEVKQGEVLGIIGRNGAGKSTLLKVLSKITDPTTGFAEIRGRVSSLLEVGTGFHPELTGRENVYLNGTILGMTKIEVDGKFDKIVDFSGVEEFIDTPVKRYSSGMKVRLAFSVAAHLEPEILIIDEVLAVGDVAFQRKCLCKMEDVSKEGRTVLFVSHNMTAVASLCNRCILLENGKITHMGPVSEVVQQYLLSVSQATSHGEHVFEPSPDLPFSVSTISTCDDHGNVTQVFPRSSPIVVKIQGKIRNKSAKYHVAIDVKTIDNTLIFRTHSFENLNSIEISQDEGDFELNCIMPPNLFPHATYRVGIITAITGKKELQNAYPVRDFDVIQNKLMGDLFIGTRGMLTPHCEWKKA